MAHHELRDRGLTSRWLSAGLCLMRLSLPIDEELRLVGPWLLSTLAEHHSLPPPGAVADVGRLLLGRPLQLVQRSARLETALHRALRRYEDHFLGRLVQERRFKAASDAVARLASSHRPRAVSLLLTGVLEGITFRQGLSINQGVVRALSRRPGSEIRAEGLESLDTDADVAELLAKGYAGLADASIEAPSLIGEAEVFTLENLEVLGDLAQRVAITHAIEAAEWLRGMLPPVLTTRRPAEGIVPTALEAESSYPTGGFASLSTEGRALENLVISELMYMEPPGEDRPDAHGVDLFDVRYAEGELLYYTRDESLIVRRRRQVVFVMDHSLFKARVKDPELDWQRIVIVQALIVTTARLLADRLGQEELLLRVAFCTPPAGSGLSALDEEHRLCELLLGEWRERGMAKVEISSPEELLAKLDQDARRSVVQVVLCAMTDRREQWQALSADSRIWIAALDVSNAAPALTILSRSPEASTALDTTERLDAKTSWARAATQLIEQLL